MRYPILIGLTIVVLLGSGACAQKDNAVQSISVTGTVKTKTAPDQIVWRTSLTSTNKDMRNAMKTSDKQVKSVLALRTQLGIDEGDIETDYLRISREYERDIRGYRGEFKHFVARRGVTIRQRDLKRFDEFIDALIASTEMEVDYSLESSRIHEVRAETRLKALAVAKEKAAAMAAALGAKLGPVLAINEHSGNEREWNIASNANFIQSQPGIDLATGKFVPGAIEVQVTVNVTFALE